MNARGRAVRKKGDAARVLLVLAWGVLGLAALPGAAPAQTLSQRQREYDAARDFVDAHTKNWEAQEELWIAWMDSISAAERRGDRARLDEADRRVLREATELARLEQLVDGARTDLAARRRALQQALEDEIDALLSRLPRTTGVTERGRLSDQLAGHEAQLAQLRVEERELDQPLMSLYVRVASLDPRAGVPRIRSLIEASERRLSEVQERIVRVNAAIANGEARLRAARQTGDAASSLGRFGSGDLVGARTRETSAQMASPALNPEEELQQLRTQLSQLQSVQRQLQAYVADLLGRIPTGGGIQ